MAAERADIAIIGGGAAGLAAAIFAAQGAGPAGSKKIVVLDGAATLGAKILVAGGGRCNVTHDVVTADDFNGSKNIVRNVLAAFDAPAAVRWFADMGVQLKREETGKLFPVTDSARTVLNALLDRCKSLGVTVQSCSKVTAITATAAANLQSAPLVIRPHLASPGGRGTGKAADSQQSSPGGTETRGAPDLLPRVAGELARRGADHGEQARRLHAGKGNQRTEVAGESRSASTSFTITHTAGTLTASRVILATGGKSLPRSGSDGGGWTIAATLGHTVTPTYMALVPLVLGPGSFHAELSGISLDVELTILAANKMLDRRRGSLLFTHFGLSGPVVMDASRHWIIARDTGRGPEMRCNFLPGETSEIAEKWLIAELAARPKASIINVLSKKFPERFVVAMLMHAGEQIERPPRFSGSSSSPEGEANLPNRAGIDPATLAGQLSREARKALLATLTALPLPIAHGRGWNYAEVTAGGVPLNEIDYRTMQSRKVPGLYLAGEILDCDGNIGGYNFQWAWATGFLAGNAAGK